MKAVILAMMLAVATPARIRFAVLGQPVSLPVFWLLAAAELLAAAGGAWLAVRVIRRCWPRRSLRLVRSAP